MTFQEHEGVVLARDLPAEGLVAGTVGAIVHVYGCDCEHYEVEFVTDGGATTLAVVTVSENDIRPR
ncbi:Uncharacterised protein [Mycobacteroides abscessus subsp. abscessus]|uniref:DUF4926 domain-containing protein n=1 Tax=Mycobacteroides abscessus TaxID=36809 RepID=UPI0009A75FFD|nr:DUF4926 domain-containing protein [Mycobacteroides abscessus]SLJ23473.1 Uncharacterised protein [Mycobacteroides abscessus subsp. abscessus]